MGRHRRGHSPEEAAYEMHCRQWNGKPYYSLDCYLKQQFGEKLYKIAIDGGMTCPNRDGTKGRLGCSFCSEGGSGDFAVPRNMTGDCLSPVPIHGAPVYSALTYHAGIVTRQIDEGIRRLKDSRKYCGNRYIAYFQSYSNTYAPISYLRPLYEEALSHPLVAGVSIATRPDCFTPETHELLATCHQQKPVWIELGLQTMHERTAKLIRRGYPLSCFEETVQSLKECGIPVIVHVILGLPGETPEDMLETIRYLNTLGINSIKLQLLHILQGTTLADDWQKGLIAPLTKDEYIAILLDCIAHLSPDIVVHRITGDGPKDLLLAPTWSLHKRDILNTIAHQMKQTHLYQGCLI